MAKHVHTDESEVSDEFKSCPFCGDAHHPNLATYYPPDSYMVVGFARECNECGGRTAWCTTQPLADKMWNRRAMLAPCGCKPYCESCGREEIAIDDEGFEFCNECAADGWSGELCWPCSKASFDDEKLDQAERIYMCAEHSSEHIEFCN